MANKGLLSSSIARKFAMALSALFLIVFLLQHMSINMLSVFSADKFNTVSDFMGTNPIVQFVLQPILLFGVIFHFVMGFVLELQNNKSRAVKYANYKGSANASWMSRNMLISGAFILLFLIIHMKGFWAHEMIHKYVDGKDSYNVFGDPSSGFRFYPDVRTYFNPQSDYVLFRLGLYLLTFVFLALHLNHGFESAWQSMGARSKKYTPTIKKIGVAYSVLVPLGFIFIAVYHYVTHL